MSPQSQQIDIDRDIVLKGNRKKMDELTVSLDKHGEGFLASFEIAMTAL